MEKEDTNNVIENLRRKFGNDEDLNKIIEYLQRKPSNIMHIPSIVLGTLSSANVMKALMDINKIKVEIAVSCNITPYKKDEDIKIYLNYFEQKIIIENPYLSVDYLVNMFFLALLDVEMNSWYLQMLQERINKKLMVKWYDIKLLIQEHFENKEQKEEIIKKLKLIKMKKDVETYNKEFTNTAKSIMITDNEEELILIYKTNLKNEFKKEIDKIEINDLVAAEYGQKKKLKLQNWLNLTLNIEKKFQTMKTCEICKKPGHDEETCKFKHKDN